MPTLSAAEFRKRDYDPGGGWCLLVGPEYELKLRLREAMIERRIAPEDRAYAVQTIVVGRATRVSEIIAAAQTITMLTPQRVVVVDSVENLSAADQRELARRLQAAPNTLVILTEGARRERPGGASRLSRELLKAAQEAGSVVECRALDRQQAVSTVIEHAQAVGASIRQTAAALLVERVGPDLGLLLREVEKLALTAADRAQITREDIEQATPRTPEDSIFAVGDAIGAGDADQALGALRDLLRYQGVEPTTALVFIQRQLRLIWQARILLDAGWRAGQEVPPAAQEILPEGAEMRSYLDGRRWLAGRLMRQAQRFSWPQLAYAVRRALQAELALKGLGEAVTDGQVALEMLAVDLCRQGGQSQRG